MALGGGFGWKCHWSFGNHILSNRNFVSKLEADVNLNMSDLIQQFRSDVVGLKEADYCLYLFSVVDLSVITIAVLLGEEKIEAVYNRKARLKLKIKQLDRGKADKYMAYL